MTSAPDRTSAIVLLAHGSRAASWQQQAEQLLANMRGKCPGQRIELAYIELNQPLLAPCLLQLAEQGYESVRILPLFIAAGKHLNQDVPSALAAVADQYPQLRCQLLSPLGDQPAFADFLIASING